MVSTVPSMRAFVALWGLTIASAAVVAGLPALGARLRDWYAFAPRGGDPTRALAIWAANARVVVLILLAAFAMRPRVRPVLDGLLMIVVGGNVALVGAALGAYGARLVPWLAHLPLEWAGFAAVLGVYTHARAAAPSQRQFAQTAAVAFGLLAVGASVEVWATPLGWP
jgi:hypothetical protein